MRRSRSVVPGEGRAPRRPGLCLAVAAVLAVSSAAAPSDIRAEDPGVPTAFRATPPPIVDAPPFAVPAVETFRLPNGLDVALLRRDDLPFVSHHLAVPAGSVHDPAGREGLAWLSAALLTRGAGKRDAREVRGALDLSGAVFDVDVDPDLAGFRLDVPRERLDAAWEVLGDALAEPWYDVLPMQAVVQDVRRGHEHESRDASAVAASRWLGLVLGAHPAGRPVRGTRNSLGRLEQADLSGFHRRFLGPDRAALAVVGDVTREELEKVLSRRLKRWLIRGGDPPAPAPAPPPRATRDLVLVDWPGASQSQVWVGNLAPPRGSPSFPAARLLMEVLGGAFHSRANLGLREERGATYGTDAEVFAGAGWGVYVMHAAVESARTAECLAWMVGEVEALTAARPVDEGERDRAVQGIERAVPMELDSAPAMARLIARTGARTRMGIAAQGADRDVTPGQLAEAARALLRPESLAVVVVGDRRTIEAPLRSRGFALVVEDRPF